MKKLFIIIALFFASQYTHAQDTLAYLQNIIANKAQYIGKPFSQLYTQLPIQVKYFIPNGDIHYNKNKETDTNFAFYFPLTNDDFYLIYPGLFITWQAPLNKEQSMNFYKQYGGSWNTTVYNFYKNAIIKDISIRD